MSKFIIQGGNRLKGKVKISGSKNAALKMMAAAILASGKVRLENVPEISDVKTMTEILESVGAKTKKIKKQVWEILPPKKIKNPDPKLISKIRASIVMVGPLLSKLKKVKIPFPGGDKIGARPIDTHLDAFSQLGVKWTKKNSGYIFEVKDIKGGKVILNEMSVTATENIILYMVLAKGESEILQAAREPEIKDLGKMLNSMGAKITGLGTSKIKIKGVKKLSGTTWRVIPDRIETASYLIAAAVSGGQVEIQNCLPSHLDIFLDKLKKIGLNFKIYHHKILVLPSQNFKATDIETRPYPGFSTDFQGPISVLLTQAQGKSKIFESMYEDRQSHFLELQKMAAKIKIVNSRNVEISGPTSLYGRKIISLDIRAGATLILAALMAKGKSEIGGANHIDRGYEDIEKKLRKLGANIKRIP